jgi:hypothetical protein
MPAESRASLGDDVVQGGAGGLEEGLDVAEGLIGLLGDVVADHLPESRFRVAR